MKNAWKLKKKNRKNSENHGNSLEFPLPWATMQGQRLAMEQEVSPENAVTKLANLR